MSNLQLESDQRFRLLPAPYVVFGLDGSIVDANPAWERVAGIAGGALGGRGIGEIIHEADRARFERELSMVSQSEQARSFDMRIVRPDGTVRWTEWSAVVLPSRTSVHAVVYDATDRRGAAEEARAQERFYATLISNLPGFVYRCRNDPTWTLEFVSTGCMELTGYASDELLENKVISFAELILVEEQGYVWEQVQAAVAQRTPYFIRYRIRAKGGEEKWIYDKGRGVFGDNGELLALAGFLTDITESVRAQQELLEKLKIIEAQKDAIRNLSTPIVEVWEGVLTLPVIGAIDAARAAEITQALLNAVATKRSRHVILDLTGVEAMDTSTADSIVRMVRAVELLGARGILVGIRPEVAQALTASNMDLSTIVTLSDLRQALLACIRGAGSR
jgi:anti-anti-sigma factor